MLEKAYEITSKKEQKKLWLQITVVYIKINKLLINPLPYFPGFLANFM